MRQALFFRLGRRLSLQNTVTLPIQILSLNLMQRLAGSHHQRKGPENPVIFAGLKVSSQVQSARVGDEGLEPDILIVDGPL